MAEPVSTVVAVLMLIAYLWMVIVLILVFVVAQSLKHHSVHQEIELVLVIINSLFAKPMVVVTPLLVVLVALAVIALRELVYLIPPPIQ
jgi:hypothetical protein